MRRIIRILLPLVAFALGASAGAWLSIGRRAADFVAGVDRRLARSSALGMASPTHPFSSDDELVTALMSAVADNDALRRSHHLREILRQLDSHSCSSV